MGCCALILTETAIVLEIQLHIFFKIFEQRLAQNWFWNIHEARLTCFQILIRHLCSMLGPPWLFSLS